MSSRTDAPAEEGVLRDQVEILAQIGEQPQVDIEIR